MASPDLPPKYLTAGADYLAAIRKLGLDPRFFGWGWESFANQWALVMVTSIVDAGGPLALNELLFKAYNAEATPKAISPFIIRIFSPEIVPDNLWMLAAKDLKISAVHDKYGRPKGKLEDLPIVQKIELTFLGIDLSSLNSYATAFKPTEAKGYHERRQEWQRFKRNVEKLAA